MKPERIESTTDEQENKNMKLNMPSKERDGGIWGRGYNQAIDDCTEVYQQQAETIERLSEEIKELKEKIYYYELPGKLIEQQQAD